MTERCPEGYVTWDEVKDETWGPVGTPRRDAIERNMDRYLRAVRIGGRVLAPLRRIPVIGGPTAGLLWWLFDDSLHGRPTVRGMLDHFAFAYLGDFLFWGRPMTQDYADSWMARVHLPRWLRVRR